MLQFSANLLDAREWNGLPGRKPGFGLRLLESFRESAKGLRCDQVVRWSGRPHARVAEARAEARSAKPEARSCAIIAINAIIAIMASITIRRLPENTKRRLRIRAARNGRSMEQEARELLEAGLARKEPEPENLGEAIRRIFAPLGGVDLKIPPRRSMVRDPGIR